MVRFDDDEIAVGHTADLDLDRSQFTFWIDHRSHNSRPAIVPLASVTRIVLESGQVAKPIPADAARKVALHFWDGGVEAGLLQNVPHRQRHGMVLELFTPTADRSEVLALPYHALKAMFFLVTWDTRSPQLQRHAGGARWMLPEHEAPLIDLPSEIRGLRGLRSRDDIGPVEHERRSRRARIRI